MTRASTLWAAAHALLGRPRRHTRHPPSRHLDPNAANVAGLKYTLRGSEHGRFIKVFCANFRWSYLCSVFNPVNQVRTLRYEPCFALQSIQSGHVWPSATDANSYS